MTKKNWILGGMGVALLLIGLSAVLYWIFWAPPTRGDFKNAQKDAEAIATIQVTPLLSQYAKSAIEERQAGKTFDEIAKLLNSQRTKVNDALDVRAKGEAKLRKSRVLRDADTKKAYDIYSAKEAKFSSYMRGYLDAFPLFQSSANTCIDIFQVTDQTTDPKQYSVLHKKASEDCLRDLKALSAVKGNKPLADYAKEYARVVNVRQKIFDDFSSGKQTEQQVIDGLREIGKAVTANDPSVGLNKLIKDSSFNGELDSLITLLKKKGSS